MPACNDLAASSTRPIATITLQPGFPSLHFRGKRAQKVSDSDRNKDIYVLLQASVILPVCVFWFSVGASAPRSPQLHKSIMRSSVSRILFAIYLERTKPEASGPQFGWGSGFGFGGLGHV